MVPNYMNKQPQVIHDPASSKMIQGESLSRDVQGDFFHEGITQQKPLTTQKLLRFDDSGE